MDALDPDPAGPGDPGGLCRYGDGAARGQPARRCGRRRARPAQRDGRAVEQEPGRREREVTPLAEPVLQHHRAGLETDHGPAEPGLRVLDDQIRLRVDFGHDPAAPVTFENVLPIHAVRR